MLKGNKRNALSLVLVSRGTVRPLIPAQSPHVLYPRLYQPDVGRLHQAKPVHFDGQVGHLIRQRPLPVPRQPLKQAPP